MIRAQRKQWAELGEVLGKPDPRSIEKEVAALLAILVPTPPELEPRTDQHPSYPRALKRLRHLGIRHNGSNHKRETIAYSKRRASAAYRMALFLVWRNWVRLFSERRGGPSSAMRLGIAERLVSVPDLLKNRLFPSRIALPERWRIHYRKELPKRAIPRGTSYELKYAA